MGDMVTVEVFETADGEGTAVKAILISLRGGESRAVLMNMSVMASPLREKAEALCRGADYLVISSAGKTQANQAMLPSTVKEVDTLILEDEKLTEILPMGISNPPVILPYDEAVFYLK
jgi:hypothetical protein